MQNEMQFGFLFSNTNFEFTGGNVEKLDNYDISKAQLIKEAPLSKGWLYPPLEALNRTKQEADDSELEVCLHPSIWYSMMMSHKLSYSGDSEDKGRFLVLCLSLLEGVHLLPSKHQFYSRIAYERGKLTGLIPDPKDLKRGLSIVSEYYDDSLDEDRVLMFSAIHWFLFGQCYFHEWERFDAQYKVLDSLYKLSKLHAVSHASRPIVLAERYEVSFPPWMEVTCNKSDLSELRNNLVHEAKYGDVSIGYGYPNFDLDLIFKSFNLKLILNMLGIKCDYLKSPFDDRFIWSYDIRN